jgi:hypothetical protein
LFPDLCRELLELIDEGREAALAFDPRSRRRESFKIEGLERCPL